MGQRASTRESKKQRSSMSASATKDEDIQWPEIFSKHVALLEEHSRIVEAAREHTSKGSASHKTIVACSERARTALEDSKAAMQIFTQQKAPLSQKRSADEASESADSDSSSSSDDENVLKAEQHRAAKRKSSEVDDPEDLLNYESVLPSRKRAGASFEPLPLGGRAADDTGFPDTMNEQPMFAVDTEPTPVQLPGGSRKHSEKSRKPFHKTIPDAGVAEEDANPRKAKKSKTQHDRQDDAEAAAQAVEKDDITDRVAARMREKEEKRSGSGKDKNKKRKRESDSILTADDEGQEEIAAANAQTDSAVGAGAKAKAKVKAGSRGKGAAGGAKPKKKKAKRSKDGGAAGADQPEKPKRVKNKEKYNKNKERNKARKENK